MPFDEIVASLERPEAWPPGTGTVETRTTHGSAVFLAGGLAVKLKRPVDLGFLDYSTRDRRIAACEAEVRVNADLAPGVYLGVAPVRRHGSGWRVGEPGEPLSGEDEPAVVMRRLPDAASLAERVREGTLDAALLDRVALRLAAFHAGARRGPDVARHAAFAAVAQRCRDNFDALDALAATRAAACEEPGGPLLDLARRATERELAAQRDLVEARAAAAVEGHGDLRLEHVYDLPGLGAPHDVVVVDRIEFSEAFRCADPVADVAFLVMDLEAHGLPALARGFAERWLAQLGDASGRALLPLHVAYRHAVRAKVRLIRSRQEAEPADERALARRLALAHVLAVVRDLGTPAERPSLLLVAGLPGTGKTTLARALSASGLGTRISSDEVRKELAGVPAGASARAAWGEGIYTRAWSERTYAECLSRALAAIARDGRAIVDANFPVARLREPFVAAARELGLPLRLVRCVAPRDVVASRLAARHGDASDADLAIHDALAAAWEEPDPAGWSAILSVDAARAPHDVAASALAALAEHGLAPPPGPRGA